MLNFYQMNIYQYTNHYVSNVNVVKYIIALLTNLKIKIKLAVRYAQKQNLNIV